MFLLNYFQCLGVKNVYTWKYSFFFCSKMCLSADRHRSVQMYMFNYGDSIPLEGLINSYPIQSV